MLKKQVTRALAILALAGMGVAFTRWDELSWEFTVYVAIMLTGCGIVFHYASEPRKPFRDLLWVAILYISFASQFALESLLPWSPERRGVKLLLWGVGGCCYILGMASATPKMVPTHSPSCAQTESTGSSLKE